MPKRISNEVLDLQICLAFDFSQAEVRILAEASGDELLISQFNSGEDIHSLIGHELTGWSVERIRKEKTTRKMTKNTVFGIIYGLGRDNLQPYIVGKIREVDGVNADISEVTPERCMRLYDAFFRKYKGVAAFVERCRYEAETLGYVETIFDFYREIRQNDESRGSYWGNQSVNTPIQSAAHQLVLMALALLHLKSRTYNLLQKPFMEVHDALYFFVKLRDLAQAYQQGIQLLQEEVLTYAYENFGRRIRVPFIAEASAGFCLGSLADYAGEPVEVFLPRWRKKHREVEASAWDKILPQPV